MLDGFALRVQDAGLEGDVDAGLHALSAPEPLEGLTSGGQRLAMGGEQRIAPRRAPGARVAVTHLKVIGTVARESVQRLVEGEGAAQLARLEADRLIRDSANRRVEGGVDVAPGVAQTSPSGIAFM